MGVSDGGRIEVYICADPAEFCERHRGNEVVRRCHHFGEFYVSEMRLRGKSSGFVDYVHDVEPWVLEEHHFETAEEADRFWRELVDRMVLRRDPPRRDQ